MSTETAEGDKMILVTSAQRCHHFSLADIRCATNDFDDKLIIGQGGFGKVYKGGMKVEETSHVVAIKRLNSMSNQGAAEFKAEIHMLSKLRHTHLVTLIGFCDENEEMILVYEYMPHGTLYDHLHKAEIPLNWMQRLKIAIGAGHGLDYLHTGGGTQHRVIHRDVKSSNILLDENWEAMISDFGLSKMGPTNQSFSYIDASVKGTFGYLDPEYFYTRKLTRQTDVYAFGVVLFELLSGRLPVDENYGDEQCSLVRWAQKCVIERKLDQMVDPNIRRTIFPKCLRRFAQIADRCLGSVLKQRPSMSQIVVSLQALLELQKRFDNSSKPSGIAGLTWKIQKYLVPTTKQNADQIGTSSSKSPENNIIQCSSPNKDGNDQCEVPLQLEELVATSLKSFTYDELNNFGNSTWFRDLDNVSVSVCKGWIDKTTYSPSEDNTRLPVVIKRLDAYECADRLELEMLKEFGHPNLEKLIGYCLQGKKLFLVYEFMHNGNFDDLLIRGGVARLPLVTKVKIAIGIARGIVFLHKTKGRLDRHKILLDEDFMAKLSGYDVTKLIQSHYPAKTRPLGYSDIGDYYPGFDPFELQRNLSGFTVVFAELLTGKQIPSLTEFKYICNQSIYQHGKLSLVNIANKCCHICNEVNSEATMLRVLERNVKRNRSKHTLGRGE